MNVKAITSTVSFNNKSKQNCMRRMLEFLNQKSCTYKSRGVFCLLSKLKEVECQVDIRLNSQRVKTTQHQNRIIR